MSSLNKVQLIGNITKDIELKSTTNGKSVCSFGLATNKKYKDSNGNTQDKTQFHNIVLWGKTAEIAGQYASKGDKIYIEGELETRSYEKDGGYKYVTEIIGQNIILLGNKKETTNNPTSNNSELIDDLLPF